MFGNWLNPIKEFSNARALFEYTELTSDQVRHINSWYDVYGIPRQIELDAYGIPYVPTK